MAKTKITPNWSERRNIKLPSSLLVLEMITGQANAQRKSLNALLAFLVCIYVCIEVTFFKAIHLLPGSYKPFLANILSIKSYSENIAVNAQLFFNSNFTNCNSQEFNVNTEILTKLF